MSNLRVRDLMTTRIYVVGPELPVALVGSLMREKHLRHVPVVSDEGRLIGLVSERDLLRSTMPLDLDEELSFAGRAELPKAVHAADIMSRNVESVEADMDLASAARIMVENKYGCLPVFDGGSLTGIITETDFLRLMSDDDDDEEEDDEDDEDDEEGSAVEEDAETGDEDDEDVDFDDDDEDEEEDDEEEDDER